MCVEVGLCTRGPEFWHGRDLVSSVWLVAHLEACWGDIESLCLASKDFWSQTCKRAAWRSFDLFSGRGTSRLPIGLNTVCLLPTKRLIEDTRDQLTSMSFCMVLACWCPRIHNLLALQSARSSNLSIEIRVSNHSHDISWTVF